MKTMGTLGMLVGIVAMASTALGSVRHVNCDVPGQTITKALKTAQSGDTIHVRGTCEVRGSGEDGIAITCGSSTLFIAERVTTAENARGGIFVIGTSTAAFDTGTVHTTQNTFGILTLGHSTLTLGRNMPTILAEDNTLDGILVADTSDLRLDGGAITAAGNRRTGLGFGGTGGLGNTRGIILSEYNTEGARAEDSSRIAQLIAGRMTIRNNTIGIIAANGSDIRLTTEAAITDNGTDIVLIFGSRGIFTVQQSPQETPDESASALSEKNSLQSRPAKQGRSEGGPIHALAIGQAYRDHPELSGAT